MHSAHPALFVPAPQNTMHDERDLFLPVLQLRGARFFAVFAVASDGGFLWRFRWDKNHP
jgi:hypothetical protein